MTCAVQLRLGTSNNMLETSNDKTQTGLGWSGCATHIEVQYVAKAGVSHKHHCVPIYAPEIPDGQACMQRQSNPIANWGSANSAAAESRYWRCQRHVLQLMGTSDMPAATRLPLRLTAVRTCWRRPSTGNPPGSW